MKMIKRALFAVAGVITIMAPLSLSAVAHAQTALDIQSLKCRYTSDGTFYTSQGCDLAVDKQVSVNGGAYVEAHTAGDAAQATIGDTITWKITISNPNAGESLGQPFGLVRVSDVLPTAGVSYDGTSYTASKGAYTSDVWEFVLFDGSTNLPATLTIVTHATATGSFENKAILSDYNPCTSENNCGWQGGYSDADSGNDQNSAWIDPSAGPQVLADTTTASSGQVLADTGSTSSTIVSIIATLIIVSTVAVMFVGRTKQV